MEGDFDMANQRLYETELWISGLSFVFSGWTVLLGSVGTEIGVKTRSTREDEFLCFCGSSFKSLFVMMFGGWIAGWIARPARPSFPGFWALMAIPERSPMSPKRSSSSRLIGIGALAGESPCCHCRYWGWVIHHFFVMFFVTSWGWSNFEWQNSFGISEHSSCFGRKLQRENN